MTEFSLQSTAASDPRARGESPGQLVELLRETIAENDSLRSQLTEAQAERDEAWDKSGAWHKLLQGQWCVYCREPLLSGSGPPCQHQKQLRRASMAGPNARDLQAQLTERDAEIERLRKVEEAARRAINDSGLYASGHGLDALVSALSPPTEVG